jgi:hypothetical protein
MGAWCVADGPHLDGDLPLMEPITEPKIPVVKIDGAGLHQPHVQVARALDIRNPWVCQKCGAIMGSVHHEKIRQGLSLSRLILFRGAVMITEMLPANFVFGKVDAGEFGCSRCGEVRKWHPSPEVLRHLSEPGHARKKNRNL